MMKAERVMELKKWIKLVEAGRPEGIKETLIEIENDPFTAGMLAGAYFYETYREMGLPIGASEEAQ